MFSLNAKYHLVDALVYIILLRYSAEQNKLADTLPTEGELNF